MKVYQHVPTRLLVQMTSSFAAMARNAFLNHRDVTEMMIVETTQTNLQLATTISAPRISSDAKTEKVALHMLSFAIRSMIAWMGLMKSFVIQVLVHKEDFNVLIVQVWQFFA